MKTNFWKRFFRCGYNFSGGGYAAHYNGKMAKTDAKTTRTKFKRLFNKYFKFVEDE